MREHFHDLYNLMASSNKVEYMRTFGNAHKEMMEWFITNKPDLAEEWLCKLESIRWKNYLTTKEAEKIVAEMSYPWSRDVWGKAMDSLGFAKEEPPYYNSCSLWVEMNKIYSLFGGEIASLLGKPLIPTDTDIITACYKMAVRSLKSGQYGIRSYFKV